MHQGAASLCLLSQIEALPCKIVHEQYNPAIRSSLRGYGSLVLLAPIALCNRAAIAGAFDLEEVAMATNPVPISELNLTTDRTPTETIVHCTGRITSDTSQSLKTTVKPLFSESKTVVLDLTNVSYLDSSGLGAIVGLYVSAKTANSQLKLINLNHHLKELFSITRLGQFLAEGRDPEDLGMP
jgi:anti-sigma B factor antagonist